VNAIFEFANNITNGWLSIKPPCEDEPKAESAVGGPVVWLVWGLALPLFVVEDDFEEDILDRAVPIILQGNAPRSVLWEDLLYFADCLLNGNIGSVVFDQLFHSNTIISLAACFWMQRKF
jgi:hypothetical protein